MERRHWLGVDLQAREVTAADEVPLCSLCALEWVAVTRRGWREGR